MQFAEPWERRCETCDGSGQVMSLAWAAWHEEYADLERIPDPPSRLRALADHVRRVPTEVEVFTCHECGGDGVVVTDMGAALLDFISRRLEPPPAPAQPTQPEQQAWSAEPPPTWGAGQDGGASYFERGSEQSMAPEPPSEMPASVAAIPDWWHHAPANGAPVRDLPAQSNGPARGDGDPWRSRPRPEWRADNWD